MAIIQRPLQADYGQAGAGRLINQHRVDLVDDPAGECGHPGVLMLLPHDLSPDRHAADAHQRHCDAGCEQH